MAVLKALTKDRKARHVSVEAFMSAFCLPEAASFQSITLPEAWVIELHASVLKEGAEQAREMYERAVSVVSRNAPVDHSSWDEYFGFVVRRYEYALVACQQVMPPGDAQKMYSSLGDIWYGLKRYDEALKAERLGDDHPRRLSRTACTSWHSIG